MTPGDRDWFIMFLSSRWGKSINEIEQMPVSEFDRHLFFWQNWKWGMSDDLLAIDIVTQMRVASNKIDIKPWQVKQWTLQRDYSWRTTHLIMKPVAAIRSGFMSIVNAMKSMGKPR